MQRWIAMGVLASVSAYAAEERYDHVGSAGLVAGGGLVYKEQVYQSSGFADPISDRGLRAAVDLGGTVFVDYSGNEVKLVARAAFGGREPELGLYAGYRGYFGDRFKTFFDLDAAVYFRPYFAIGPRAAFGLQFELTPIIGLYAGIAAQAGWGQGFRFSAELCSGFQFRSYLLE